MLKCLIMFTLFKCFYWTLFYLHSFPGKSPSLHGKQASKPSMWKRDSCSVLLSLGSHSPDPRTQHPPACLLMHFSEAFESLIHPFCRNFFSRTNHVIFLAFQISFGIKWKYRTVILPNEGPPVRGTWYQLVTKNCLNHPVTAAAGRKTHGSRCLFPTELSIHFTHFQPQLQHQH